MAFIETQVGFNNTGKGSNEAIPLGAFVRISENSFGGGGPEAADVYVEQLSDGRYVNYVGDFTVNGNTITGGELEVVYVANVALDSTEFPVPPEVYLAYAADEDEVVSMTEVLKPQSNKDFYAYLFRFDDLLIGSEFKDKINGWEGDDLIWGHKDKDKIWGGPGNDTFYYVEGDGKDRYKDYSKKKDSFVFDRDLVRNLNKLKKVAEQKKNKVIVDFGGGDKVIIDDIKLKKFLKSDVSFLEVDF